MRRQMVRLAASLCLFGFGLTLATDLPYRQGFATVADAAGYMLIGVGIGVWATYNPQDTR